MRRIGWVAALLAVGALVSAPTAHADGRCLFEGDWDCYGPPQYNGPSLPTWDVPGTYGGWTTNPVLCDPVSDTCRQAVTP